MSSKLLIFLLLVCGTVYAVPAFVNDSLSKAEEQHYMESTVTKNYFSTERWKDAKEGITYEKEREEKTPEPIAPNLPFTLDGIKYFIFGAVIVLLIALLTFLAMQLKLKRTPKKKTAVETFSTHPEKEEDLLSMDLEPQIQEAIQKQQFTIAVRLLYLLTLQRLVRAQLLHWSKDQTNRHMLHLLHNKPFTPLLQTVFSTYESTWFGKKTIDATGFQGFQSTHSHLLQQIEEAKG